METEQDPNWPLELNKLQKEYYDLRTEFYNAVERYYRQSPYSNYVKESTLIEYLEKLRILREKLNSISRANYPDTSGSLYRGDSFKSIIDRDCRITVA